MSVGAGSGAEGSWIDRTNAADTAVGDGYALPADLADLCLTNNRLRDLAGLRGVPRLRRLILRQNALTALPALGELPLLEELDCYINEIKEIDPAAFAGCPALRKLDLSFNDLRDMDKVPVGSLGNVEELFLISNKIKAIRNLHSMPKLTFLELGDNRIRAMENLDAVPSVTSLWLGRNKIERIQGVDNFPCLQILSLQSNRITRIEAIAHLTTLTELYLSHNGIERIEGVSSLTNLSVLDVSANAIARVEGIAALVNLTEFWANDNAITDLDEVGAELAGAAGLQTVYLEGNPCARADDYQERALAVLPQALTQLDALPVPHVRRLIEKRAADKATADAAAVVDGPAVVEEMTTG